MAKKKPIQADTISILPPDGKDIVDSRITRAEAVELMLEEARDQVRRRLEEIDKELRQIYTLTAAEAAELAALSFSASLRFGYNSTGQPEEVSFRVSSDQPGWLQVRAARYRGLRAETETLRRAENALADRGRAKFMVMKQILEKTAEGREFIENISRMSSALRKQLLEAAAEERSTATKLVAAVVVDCGEG